MDACNILKRIFKYSLLGIGIGGLHYTIINNNSKIDRILAISTLIVLLCFLLDNLLDRNYV